MVIKDLLGFAIKNFILASPKYEIRNNLEEIRQECEILAIKYSFLANEDIDWEVAKEFSNECKRRSYEFWKERGWKKTRGEGEKKNKVSWFNPEKVFVEDIRKKE